MNIPKKCKRIIDIKVFRGFSSEKQQSYMKELIKFRDEDVTELEVRNFLFMNESQTL